MKDEHNLKVLVDNARYTLLKDEFENQIFAVERGLNGLTILNPLRVVELK